MTEGIFIKILSSILIELSKAGFKALMAGTPTDKAISLTAGDFPSLENVKSALTVWTKSEDFIEELERIQESVDDTQISLITDSFILKGGFYDNVTITNTDRTAQTVLASFFRHLEAELYKSEHGRLIEATKAKLRYQETLFSFNQLSQQGSEQTQEIKSHIDESIKPFLSFFDLESSPELKEKLHLQTIDFAVQLLREGKMETAKAKLMELRETIGGEIDSINLRFRLTANIGICALHLNDLNSARTEFQQALVLKPDHKLILAHLALVLALQREVEQAVDYAFRSYPFDDDEHRSVVAAHYIRVMHMAKRPEEIKSLLETDEWIEKDANCAISLGIVKFDEGNFELSEIYFKTAHEGDLKNPHTLRLLAQTLITPIDQMFLKNPPLYLSVEHQNRLCEAEQYLSESIAIFDKYENKTPLFEALLQRAYVRDLLADSDGSLADCEWLLILRPKNDEALRQKGQTLLFNGRTADALTCFNEIKDEKSREAAIVSIALAYFRAADYPKVIDLIAERLDTSATSRQHIILIDLLLTAYDISGLTQEVTHLISQLLSERSDDPEILMIVARQYLRSKDPDQAGEFYEKALSIAEPGNQTLRISLELADVYHRFGKWNKAAELYEEYIDKTVDNPLTRRYLISLYNSGARDKAFDLAKSLRNEGNAIPFISEIEANVLLVLGENEEALRLVEQLVELEPEKVSHRFSVIKLQEKIGDVDQARNVIEEIKFEEIKDDANALIYTAHLRQKFGLGGELPFAYRAREIAVNNKQVHHDYIRLFLEHTNQVSGDMNVEKIEIDHFVELRNKHGDVTTYHIVKGGDFDVTKGEIPDYDPRAQKLLGLKKGSSVVFNEGTPADSRYEISEVKNKYVYAFQESIKKNNQWFGGASDRSDRLMVMDVARGDFSSFFKMLDSQRQHREFVENKFREGIFPMATMARLSGESLFESWSSIVDGNGFKLVCSIGTSDQFDKEIETVKTSKEIVVEISGLLTLGHLDLLDNLRSGFRRVVISRSVYETLKQWRQELDAPVTFSTIWEGSGGRLHGRLSDDAIEKRRQLVGKIVSFVEAYAEVLPTTKVLSIPSEKLEDYRDAFGESFNSILLAHEHDLPLYLDDQRLASVFKSEGWEITVVSIQAILTKFRKLGLISSVEYWSALKKLILSNYAHILLDSDALWWICRDEGKRPTTAIEKIIKIVLGPPCSDDAALLVGLAFIRQVCLEITDEGDRTRLVELTIETILDGRDKKDLTDKLEKMITKAFPYSKNQQDFVIRVAKAHK